MTALHYLTVQDMLWINHRVTGKVLSFRYDLLEEATFYQYAYGQSTDLEAQAKRFVEGFASKAPFGEGDRATAVVGAIAFLRANGKDAAVDSKTLKAWISSGSGTLDLKLREGDPSHGVPDVKPLVEGVLADLGKAIGAPEAQSATA